MIPNDPYILLSYLNTKLRDDFEDIDDLCSALDLDKAEIVSKLSAIGYNYDRNINQFK